MISVAICTWNRSALLDQTLARMTQLVVPTGVTWELLVVDNPSTDDSGQVIQNYQSRLPVVALYEEKKGHSNARNCAINRARGDYSTKDDPESVVRAVAGDRVGFFRQPNNVGHTRNFESCLQRTRGHLVHLLHGDDAVLSGFYRKMNRPFAENSKLGAAFCRNITMNRDGNWLDIASMQMPQSGIFPDLVERLAVQQLIQTPAMVVRREAYESLGGFDRRLSWTEDWEMWARIAMHYPVWYESEPLALYRVHDSSNSGRYFRTGETLRDVKRLFEITETYVPNVRGKSLRRKGRELHARMGLITARHLLGQRDFAAAANHVRGSLALCLNLRLLAQLASLMAWFGWRASVHAVKVSLRYSFGQ